MRSFAVAACGLLACSTLSFGADWKKHVVHEGEHCNSVVGGDFTRDGKIDVISNSGGKTRLFVGPSWTEYVIDETPGHGFIRAESFDVDGDGDLDFIGARYQPGRSRGSCPDHPTAGP